MKINVCLFLWFVGPRRPKRDEVDPHTYLSLSGIFQPQLDPLVVSKCWSVPSPTGRCGGRHHLLALWVRKVAMGWVKSKWLLSLLRASQLGNGRSEGKATLKTTHPLTIFFRQEELCILMEKWILEHTSSLHTAHNSFVSQPDQHPSVFYHVRVIHKSCEILSITCKIPYEFESP